MPPSPSLRISPGREMRTDNHKRGRSLEGGLLVREKDDDLTLFNEMQNKESDNFLLDSTDDLDDSLTTKLRYFSDYKLGISIPARGDSSDLLNDGDKNDYDWLLTPPDTPLFPSLDDEVPPVNLQYRGRPRSQPISIARSNTMETTSRNSRSSASPHRLSLSPRSSNSTLQSRGRPLSATHSNATPILRPTTPSRSPSRSTTPVKPSTPGPRSSTPTPRRMSTGSSVTVASSGRAGTSPVKTTRGDSASPKLRAWQSNIPGFPTDAPPNLRTSLADRPASYVRGSSPASRNGRGSSPASSNGRGLSPVSSSARGVSPPSRNGRDSSSKRQSMSPTASRSASSSWSHDRDQFSSRSKGSVASSGDDDMDSLQSFSVSVSERSAIKKVGGFPGSRAQGFSKKPSRVLSSSAPKRSFDSALRQMDRRSPINMFRPLLSSVPSTTFYAGKASSSHRSVISRNSSVTTSSNASSEQGASFAPDNEGSDHEQGHSATTQHPDVQDEVFGFGKVDEIDEDIRHGVHEEELSVAHDNFESNENEIKQGEFENFSQDIASTGVAFESTCVQNELLETDLQGNRITCSKCGKDFAVAHHLEESEDICPDCIKEGGCLHLSTPETILVTRSSTLHSELTKENESFDELGSEKLVSELTEFTSREATIVRDETIDREGKTALSDGFTGKSIEEGENHFVDQQALTDGLDQSACDSLDQQPLHFSASPSLKVDSSQGVGISVLLRRSNSGKGPVFQGRTFTSSTTSLDDLSYARDSMNSFRSSLGHGSFSASSSVDLSSSRQTDGRVQRQSSSRKVDLENSRHGMNIRPLSRGSSFSGHSNHTSHAMALDMSTSEENFDVCTGKMEFEALEEVFADTEKEREPESGHFVSPTILEEEKLDSTESCVVMDAPASESLSQTSSTGLMDTSVAILPDEDNHISSASAEESTNNPSISDIEVSTSDQGPLPTEEDDMLRTGGGGDADITDDPTLDSSILTSEELGADHEFTTGSQNETALSSNPKNIADELQEHSVPANSEEAPVSPSKPSIPDLSHDILEESTVTIQGSGGHQSKSLTLEEATDTILFCSSIIHNMAYQAATIGLEKEQHHRLSLEGSRPTITILSKPSPDRKPKPNNKRTPKSKQKRVEITDTGTKTTSSPKNVPETKTRDIVPRDSEIPSTRPPLKLESKCNCSVM